MPPKFEKESDNTTKKPSLAQIQEAKEYAKSLQEEQKKNSLPKKKISHEEIFKGIPEDLMAEFLVEIAEVGVIIKETKSHLPESSTGESVTEKRKVAGDWKTSESKRQTQSWFEQTPPDGALVKDRLWATPKGIAVANRFTPQTRNSR